VSHEGAEERDKQSDVVLRKRSPRIDCRFELLDSRQFLHARNLIEISTPMNSIKRSPEI